MSASNVSRSHDLHDGRLSSCLFVGIVFLSAYDLFRQPYEG